MTNRAPAHTRAVISGLCWIATSTIFAQSSNPRTILRMRSPTLIWFPWRSMCTQPSWAWARRFCTSLICWMRVSLSPWGWEPELGLAFTTRLVCCGSTGPNCNGFDAGADVGVLCDCWGSFLPALPVESLGFDEVSYMRDAELYHCEVALVRMTYINWSCKIIDVACCRLRNSGRALSRRRPGGRRFVPTCAIGLFLEPGPQLLTHRGFPLAFSFGLSSTRHCELMYKNRR